MFLNKFLSKLFKKQSYTDGLNLSDETYKGVYQDVVEKEKELNKQLRKKVDDLKKDVLK